MGPPSGGFDTSKVWSPAGGWFPDPKAWKRNTFFGFVAVGVASVTIFNYSRQIEVSPPPTPSPPFNPPLTRPCYIRFRPRVQELSS